MNREQYEEYWESLPLHQRIYNTLFYWWDEKFNNSQHLHEFLSTCFPEGCK